jgi:hypothetical protein
MGSRSRTPRARSVLLGAALAAASIGATLGLFEAALRLFPTLIPPGVYGAGRFDPALGMHVRASEVLYTRRGVVRKTPNADGFLDVAHAEAKPPGTVRVGFFGDSYVESNQVPTGATFFRRLPEALEPRRVEPLAFGLSGWGTLQAFRAYTVHARRYGLDLAVYVFVENDPGDNSLALSAHRHDAEMPYATLADAAPGYRVREGVAPDDPPWFRLAKAVQARSLLAQVVWVRLRLLQQEGFRPRARAEEKAMRERAPRAPGSKPDPNDIPTSWSAEERTGVLLLAERILADWQRTAQGDRIPLAVLYVPRGNEMLAGALREEDTWLPWLRATCAKLGLPLLDPSAAFRASLDAGAPPYDDHLTPAGHAALAGFLAAELPRLLEEDRHADERLQ